MTQEITYYQAVAPNGLRIMGTIDPVLCLDYADFYSRFNNTWIPQYHHHHKLFRDWAGSNASNSGLVLIDEEENQWNENQVTFSPLETPPSPSIGIWHMQTEYGFFGERPSYPVTIWQREVASGKTRLGYWEWATIQPEPGTSCPDGSGIGA
jgi:hypothetical protein